MEAPLRVQRALQELNLFDSTKLKNLDEFLLFVLPREYSFKKVLARYL